jgi:DNA excision repair protein ERCC-6-like 2
VIQRQLSTSSTLSSDGESEPSSTLVHERKKPECVPKKQKIPLIDERKRAQFSLLAESMGMGELAFSKWLLSATSVEREKVLIDYKKKKKKLKG